MAGEVATTRNTRTVQGRVESSSYQRPPRTQYIYVTDSGAGQQQRRGYYSASYRPQRTSVPKGVPSFLGNRQVIFMAWAVAMAVICWDEWHNNNILPRPQRLWYGSLLYGLLALVSTVDPMVPLCNAIAIGYDITLLYQYYGKTGQFGGGS